MTEAEKEIVRKFDALIEEMRKAKPGDRSEKDRYFAIAITQTELAKAAFIGLVAGQA